ncbi:MAG: hypothetical protein CO187_02890 [Zetaproteobacteria bacterium CG_4_9_14_3_um_filter_53_7]|nr:MAG: hypothetical protein CO187_02890 [Zetaproteobacteria bacterium CG_4_9_14_3_um_filter_53_7]
MVIDTIIFMLFVAIAAVVGIILWKGAEAKPYDPNAVDLSRDFDPKHDHFSEDHAKKLRRLANEERSSRLAQTPGAETFTDSAWDSHLRPAEHPDGKIVRSETDRRSYSDRRMFEDRRQPQ